MIAAAASKKHSRCRIINVAPVDRFKPEPSIDIYTISKVYAMTASKAMTIG